MSSDYLMMTILTVKKKSKWSYRKIKILEIELDNFSYLKSPEKIRLFSFVEL